MEQNHQPQRKSHIDRILEIIDRALNKEDTGTIPFESEPPFEDRPSIEERFSGLPPVEKTEFSHDPSAWDVVVKPKD